MEAESKRNAERERRARVLGVGECVSFSVRKARVDFEKLSFCPINPKREKGIE